MNSDTVDWTNADLDCDRWNWLSRQRTRANSHKQS